MCECISSILFYEVHTKKYHFVLDQLIPKLHIYAPLPPTTHLFVGAGYVFMSSHYVKSRNLPAYFFLECFWPFCLWKIALSICCNMCSKQIWVNRTEPEMTDSVTHPSNKQSDSVRENPYWKTCLVERSRLNWTGWSLLLKHWIHWKSMLPC